MVTKTRPTIDTNIRLTKLVISDCASARALCIFCRISPERWSSKTEYGSENECDTLRSYSCRAGALGDDVDVVVLKVLGDARHQRHADVAPRSRSHAAEERSRGRSVALCSVIVDDAAGRPADRAARRPG